MLVVLKEHVENVGSIGDVVKVSDGYARNYLIPRNLVVVADEHNIAAIDHEKRLLEKKRSAMRSVSEQMAEKVSQTELRLTRKVSEHDKLFGSVGVSDLLHELTALGIDLPKRALLLEAPIKALGTYSVPVRLDGDVLVTLKVIIAEER